MALCLAHREAYHVDLGWGTRKKFSLGNEENEASVFIQS